MAEKADVVVNNVTYRDVPGIQLTAAGGGTVTYTLVDYPIAIEKGGTGATTSADALIQLGAVAKSGDTMTGDLQAIEIRATNKSTSDYATFAFKDRTTASGIIAGYVSENVSTRRILFGEYTPETNREVYFRLPELSSSDTAAGYDIVTTKGDYALGGILTAPEMRIKNDSYPSLYYQTTSGIIGRTLVNHTSHNMSFREMKSGAHFDAFTLPTPTLTEETDNYYDIVTTKGNYTMTGTLNVAAPIASYHSTTPSFAYKTSASGSPIAESAARANTRQIFFREYASDTAYHEDYLLPEHSTGATGNAIYSIVTTKGDYTMGGTLMTPGLRLFNADAPGIAFRASAGGTNLGALNLLTASNRYAFAEKGLDTNYQEQYLLPAPDNGLTSTKSYSILTTKGSYVMSGALTAKTLQTYNRGDNYASLSFKNTTTGSDNAAMNCYLTNNRLFITEYSPGTTYVERFYLPAPDSSRTAHADYNILTTKEHPAYTVQTLDWSSSNYINANYDVWVEKALDTVRFQGLFTFTNLTANTTVEIGTLPVGYRPNNRIERTIGISMQANWNTPATIGAQFVLVSVYSNGIVKINPGATPNTNSFWIDMTWAI